MAEGQSRIEAVHALGQSLWLDDVRREMIESGELRRRIAAGEIRGMTSNPTIFEQAISGSELYTDAIRRLAQAGWSAERILDNLTQDDIRSAADLLRPVYEATQGGDGFVSLEVSPDLATETEATLGEVRRLWAALNRPNVMIKIPATQAGVPAIRQAVAEGVNVNITLIFSLKRYAEVIEAYLAGLEERLVRGAALDHIASVASFFVSRVDTAVDALLETVLRGEGANAERAAALRGQAAIANARLAYAQFQAAFGSDRFEALRAHGARPQRPLWASTSTKNPAYPDTYYLDNLIGPQTVNTVPLVTLEAFRDHGTVAETLGSGLSSARSRLEALESLGISMDQVTSDLERQGVEKFADSFAALLRTIDQRAARARRELAPLLPGLGKTLEALDRDQVARRLWSKDGTLWPGRPEAWLGWLELPQAVGRAVPEIASLARQAAQDGFAEAVLLGMGGSSLAPEVFRGWAPAEASLQLTVLDTIEPSAVRRVAAGGSRPLFIVASKSGTTIEPLSLMDHFWREHGGRGEAFVAITDVGTPLEALARERGFRAVFLAPQEVGGRYSALSVFGLVPAGLAGVDLSALGDGASAMARESGPNVEAARNPGLFLGAVLAAAWREGRDKVTLVADDPYGPFLAWIEQLLAESSGKDGKGIFPIVGEPPGPAKAYGADRLLVYLRTDGSQDERVERWIKAGLPVVIVSSGRSPQALGAAFFRWEVAVAVACHLMQVNAFDQPDVERAKVAARGILQARSMGSGKKPGAARGAPAKTLAAALDELREGDAFVILAFLAQTPTTERAVETIRRRVRDQLGNATLAGFGPRYLHSTGQLFKGGPDRIVAVVLHAPPRHDVAGPDGSYSFGDLLEAQAKGDFEAMRTIGRRAFFLGLESPGILSELARSTGTAAASAARRRSSGSR